MAWCLGRAPTAEQSIRLLRPGPWQAAGGSLAHAGSARPEAHIPMMVIPSERSRRSTPTPKSTGYCPCRKQAHAVSPGKK